MTGGQLSSLTQREREVLQQMAKGLSCRSIARVLDISEFTVKTHRRNMLAKHGLRNAAQLLELARREHYLPRPVKVPSEGVLSPREHQIMQLVIEGLTSKQISRRLGITDLTVRKHRENLLRKLKLNRSAQLNAESR